MKHLKTYENKTYPIYKVDPNYKFEVVMYMLNMTQENIDIFNKVTEIFDYNYIYLDYNEFNNWWSWDIKNKIGKVKQIITLSKDEIDEAEKYYKANKYNI